MFKSQIFNINLEPFFQKDFLFSSEEGWQSVPFISAQLPSFSLSFWCGSWGLSVLLALLLLTWNHEKNHAYAKAGTSGFHSLHQAILSFWSTSILERVHLSWRQIQSLSTKSSQKEDTVAMLSFPKGKGTNNINSINYQILIDQSTRILSYWFHLFPVQRKTTNIWITALFFVILSSNIFGLIPFFEAITGKVGFTLGISFAVWGAVTYSGIQRLGIKTVKLFLPSGPSWPMAPVFVLLELISYCFRAISLGVRLWANMLAGHQLIHLVTAIALVPALCLNFVIGAPVTALAAGLLMALTGLESIVCVLQSGVFCLLAGFYLNEVLGKKDIIGPKNN
jgi:ATP synthase subunit 6